MREYGQVQCSFWIDPEIQSLSDNARTLALYLMTGPHSNGLGCYRAPKGYIQADLGWSLQTIKEAFTELSGIGFVYRCRKTGYLIIPNFLRWNSIINANVATAREREFNLVPKEFEHYGLLIQSLIDHGKHWGKAFGNHLESISKGYAKPVRTQDHDPEHDPDHDPEHDPDHDPEQEQEGDSTEQTSCSPPAMPVASLVEIPLNDGSEHPVVQSDLDEWAELYPAVDVLQELRNMRGWCLANPRQRKTKSGVARFINTWLAKEQDRGGTRPKAAAPTSRRRELGHD